MKKVALKDVVQPTPNKNIKLSKVLDYLTDLGWEYTCNCMTRSGMQTYDELMQYIGVLQPTYLLYNINNIIPPTVLHMLLLNYPCGPDWYFHYFNVNVSFKHSRLINTIAAAYNWVMVESSTMS